LNADKPDPYRIDSALARRAGNRSAHDLQRHGEVVQTIAQNLLERLDLLRKVPQSVLVLGCGHGTELAYLRKRFPRALIIGADIADVRLERIARAKRFWQSAQPLLCFDPAQTFPFASDTFDLVIGNLVLPWIFPAQTFASELNRVIATDGGFFLSAAGPDTLLELRQAWAAVDNHAHINAMPDMHDLGDLLVGAGVADPVVDVERLAVRYSNAQRLLTEMRGLGLNCTLAGRRRGLFGTDIHKRLSDQLTALGAERDGSVLASLEIVYAHGWKGQPKQSGSVQTFPLERLTQTKQG
jgi:malonyl-CoA O-methyltransferase